MHSLKSLNSLKMQISQRCCWTDWRPGQPYLLEPWPAKLQQISSSKLHITIRQFENWTNFFSLEIFPCLERYLQSVQLVTDFRNKSCPQIDVALCPVIVKSPQIKEEPQVEPPGRRLNLLTIFSRSRYRNLELPINNIEEYLKVFWILHHN